MFRSKNEINVIDVFKTEINHLKNEIKEEIYKEFEQILNNVVNQIDNLQKYIAHLENEIKLIKNETKEQQKIAISSTVEGLAKVRISEALQIIKNEIIEFLKNNELELDFSELERKIDEIVHNKTIGINDKLISLEKKINELSLSNLENKISELHNKLEETKPEINIDFSQIENKINELESKINELENKIDYIYKFNKLLEQQLKQKQKETIESEEE